MTPPVRRKAIIIAKHVNAPGRPALLRPFYHDECGDEWAVPREHEYRALLNQTKTVEIEIRCFDDQFAYPVTK